MHAPEIDRAEAERRFRQIFENLEASHSERVTAIFVGMLAYEVNPDSPAAIEPEKAHDMLDELLEEIEEEAIDSVAEVVDALWDFEDYPGGPIGSALEELDGPFWERVFTGLSEAARAVGAWVRDVVTLDDLKIQARVERLQERASDLQAKATRAVAAGRAGRARRLQRRATQKLRRAAKLKDRAS